MNLTINGTNREIPGVAAVSDLLGVLDLSQARLVVELNGAIVKQGAFAATILRERDRIEIVRLVGGG